MQYFLVPLASFCEYAMPRIPFSIRLALAMGLALVANTIWLQPVSAYPRRRSNHSHNYSAMYARQQQAAVQAAMAQKNAAEQVLKAAEATGSGAQSKLADALLKLRQEAEKFHDAQSTTRHAAKELAEIEQEIIEEQTEDSPYRQATKRVETARQKLKAVEDRILSEPAVEAKLAALSSVALVDARANILSLREDYLVPKEDFNTEANALAKLRSELFQADQHWKEAAESLTHARKLEKDAEENTHGGTSGRVGLNLKAKNAAEAAAAARVAIAQADAVIKANSKNNTPGRNNGPPSKAQSSPGNQR
jgi:hypothetical protein